jgi:hypothetical protein
MNKRIGSGIGGFICAARLRPLNRFCGASYVLTRHTQLPTPEAQLQLFVVAILCCGWMDKRIGSGIGGFICAARLRPLNWFCGASCVLTPLSTTRTDKPISRSTCGPRFTARLLLGLAHRQDEYFFLTLSRVRRVRFTKPSASEYVAS